MPSYHKFAIRAKHVDNVSVKAKSPHFIDIFVMVSHTSSKSNPPAMNIVT
jgi:hypothetical protein